ncbi:MAG: M16 family metallopeptidase [Nitrospirota bacterium]
MYKKEILDNGITVVTESIPHVRSVSLGIWVNVGSRDEREGEDGISHFVEHMLFKGTTSRSAKDIASEIDSIGGELNAFTSREITTYYVKVLDEYLPKAIDILSDIFYNSAFDPEEIEKEKQVVIEEIKTVEDSPEDYVHDLHAQNILKGNPLGKPILGNLKVIKSLTREKIIDFIERNYYPQNIVISVAGNLKFDSLIDSLSELFGKRSEKDYKNIAIKEDISSEIKGDIVLKKRKLEQTHICCGTKGLPIAHKDRYGIYILNSLLGGSVSSRLFQEVREKRGLAYSIYSYLSSYRDIGIFNIYAATGLSTGIEVINLIKKEFNNLRENGINQKELQTAINYLKGHLMLSMESTGSRMSRLAKDEIYQRRFFSLDEIMNDVEIVSMNQIEGLINELLKDDFFTLTTLGAISKEEISLID